MNKRETRKHIESAMYWLRSALDTIEAMSDLRFATFIDEDDQIPTSAEDVINDCIKRALGFLS